MLDLHITALLDASVCFVTVEETRVCMLISGLKTTTLVQITDHYRSNTDAMTMQIAYITTVTLWSSIVQ